MLLWKVVLWSYSGPYFPAFELNTGKCGPEKLQIRTPFTQWKMEKLDSDWQKEDENDLVKESLWQKIDRKSDFIHESKFKTWEKIEGLEEINYEDIE